MVFEGPDYRQLHSFTQKRNLGLKASSTGSGQDTDKCFKTIFGTTRIQQRQKGLYMQNPALEELNPSFAPESLEVLLLIEPVGQIW